MSKNVMRFKKSVTTISTAIVLGSLLMLGGCGGGGSSTPAATTTTKTTAIPAGSVTASGGALTVVSGLPVTATPQGSTVNAISIPTGVTITPPSGTTYTAATTIDVTTFNTLSAMPAPLTAGYRIDATAGAVDVKIGGVNGATFSAPVTITIPLNVTPATSGEVYVNKGPGKGYVDLGPAINHATCNTNGYAQITVNDLCTYTVDPHFTNGSTGGTGF